MAYRNSADVRDIVTTVRLPFKDLDPRERERQEIEAGTFDYTKFIPVDLYGGPPGKPSIVRSRKLTGLSQLMMAAISQPLRPVVDISRRGSSTAKVEDSDEAFFAHARLRLDMQGWHKRERVRNMVRSRFHAEWLYIDPYAPPREPKEAEEYAHRYWRYGQRALHPGTVGFERVGDDLTVAVVEELIPIIDLAQYDRGTSRKDGEETKDYVARAYGQIKGAMTSQAAREGSPMNIESGTSELWGKSYVKRYIVDDGAKICVYIEQPTTDGKQREYIEVDEAPNPFGQCSLIVYTGIYRGENAPIKERYEAMIGAAADLQYDVTMLASIALTVAGNPQPVEQLSEALATQMGQQIAAGADPEKFRALVSIMRDDRGVRKPMIARGEYELVQSALGEGYAIAYQSAREDLAAIEAEWHSIFPDRDTVGKAPYSSIFAAIEQGQKITEDQQASIIAGETRKMRMIAYDVANTHKMDIEFSAFGREQVSPGHTLDTSKTYKFGPTQAADYPHIATVTLEPVPDSRAAQSAAVSEQLALLNNPTGPLATPADVLEAAGVGDVSRKLIEIATHTNTQALAPQFARGDAMRVLEKISRRHRLPLQELMRIYAPQLAAPQGQGGGGGIGSALSAITPDFQPAGSPGSAPAPNPQAQ